MWMVYLCTKPSDVHVCVSEPGHLLPQRCYPPIFQEPNWDVAHLYPTYISGTKLRYSHEFFIIFLWADSDVKFLCQSTSETQNTDMIISKWQTRSSLKVFLFRHFNSVNVISVSFVELNSQHSLKTSFFSIMVVDPHCSIVSTVVQDSGGEALPMICVEHLYQNVWG
jgi:hypothetical protein